MDENKLKLLEIVSNLAERESDRTWRRFSIMLIINTGLMALVSLSGDKFLYIDSILGGILGVILSVVWFQMITLSTFYEKRWHADMIEIIESDPEIQRFVRGRSDETCRINRPTERSASSYARILPISLGILWVLIASVSIYRMVSLLLL